MVFRASLENHLVEFIGIHEHYTSAAEYNSKKDKETDNWMKKIEATTRNAYKVIDRYIRTSRSSICLSAVDGVMLLETLRGILDNHDQKFLKNLLFGIKITTANF